MTQPGEAPRAGKIVVRIDAEYEALIPAFLENRHKDIRTVRDAVDQGNYDLIRLLGHSMKGTGAAYGFEAIGDLGSQLEEAAKDGNSAAIRQSLDELTAYLERVEVVFE